MLHANATALFIVALAASAAAQDRPSADAETPTIAAKTAGMKKHGGFLTFYWDGKAEHLWLEISLWNTEFLHAVSTASAVAGRDRGGWGSQRILKFARAGSKVFLIQPNYSPRGTFLDELLASGSSLAHDSRGDPNVLFSNFSFDAVLVGPGGEAPAPTSLVDPAYPLLQAHANGLRVLGSTRGRFGMSLPLAATQAPFGDDGTWLSITLSCDVPCYR